MLADDYANKSSCMNVDLSNKLFPIIDLCEYCPSTPSSLSPVPCFSGQNLVKIKHVGNVPMSQLRIGDYVMSGNDKFTQVYGFGHFEHKREATFLQIMFHDDENDKTMSTVLDHESSSNIIEISVRHLIMIDRNHKQF
jgi:hypothetical protein